MTNTLKIFFLFNKKTQIFLIFIFSLLLSILEAIGFAILTPFVSFLLNFNTQLDLVNLEQSNILNKYILNIFEIEDKLDFLKIYIASIFLFYSLKFILILFVTIFNSSFVFNFRDNMQKKILNNFILQPYKFHLNFSSTDKVRFTSDEITNYCNQIIIPSIFVSAEIFIVLSLLIFAYFYSSTFFLFFLFFSIICIIIVQIVRKILKKIGETRLINELSHQTLQQIFSSIKDIIIFSKEKEFLTENNNFTKKISKSDKKYLVLEVLPRHIIELITVLIFCFIFYFYYININVDLKNILPKIAIYTLIFFRIMPSFTKIARGLSAMSYGKQIENKIVNYINLTNRENSKLKKYPFNKSILIKYLEYSYDNENKCIYNN